MQFNKFLLFAALFAYALLLPVFAGKTEVYVSNRCIGIAVPVKDSGYYIALDLLQKAATTDIIINESTGKMQIKGKILEKSAIRLKNGWLVPVKETGLALGYEYKYDKGTNIIDLFKKPALSLLQPLNSQTASPPKELDDKERSRFINKDHEGDNIDIKQYIVPGKINLFCFYSDNCSVCVRTKPLLEQLVKSDTNVVVNYINIDRPNTQGIDWSSPLAQQYGIHYTPNFKIYDSSGNLIAEDSVASQKVQEMFSKMGNK